MSYILDALRRADSERERGGVPGLNTQPADLEAHAAKSGAMPKLLIGGMLLMCVVLLGALVWVLRDRPAAPTLAVPPPPIPITTPIETAAPAASAVLPVPAPTLSEATPPATPPRRKLPPSTPTAAAPEAHVPALSELPAALQQEIPQLVVGGAMYSATPANRMLILNGQVFHEHDQIAPHLTLAQIKLKSAVLEYKGQRYLISY